MVPRKMSLATSICGVLALLHRSTVIANESVPGDKPKIWSPFNTDISDVILLSFNRPWKEADSRFARWIQRPITTWSVQNEAFTKNYRTGIIGAKKPVFSIVGTGKKPSVRGTLHIMWFTCSSAFLTVFQPDIRKLSYFWHPKSAYSEFKGGYLTLNETSMQNFFWPQDEKLETQRTAGKPTQFDRYRVQSLGGSTLRVACVNKSIGYTCNDTIVLEKLALLNRRNVTVQLAEVANVVCLLLKLISNDSDIALFPTAVDDSNILGFDFPMTFIVHDAFYSRVNPHRVVSVIELAGESLNVVATTALMLALVVLASVVMGNKNWSFFEDISDTAFFLLAAFLATSAVQPNIRGFACTARKALLGIWLLSLFPLSVYFRSQLNAIVTLRRPSDRIDTLQKLEDAIDRREVAPCVVRHTSGHFELHPHPTHLPQSLLSKLQFEFARLGEKELVTENLPDCLQCASRRNRVCYIGLARPPNSSLLKLSCVAPLSQHLKMKLGAIHARKSHRLYQPLRRFFLRIEEHKLTRSNAAEPEYRTGDTEIAMYGLLMLLGILHATSCLVLVLEVVIARYRRRA